jgi:hypothetical protein
MQVRLVPEMKSFLWGGVLLRSSKTFPHSKWILILENRNEAMLPQDMLFCGVGDECQ